jgi:peptide/nickel transport system ATP-binding protein
MTALALMGLLPAGAAIGGMIRFAEQNLAELRESEFRSLRGNRIAMTFQEPMTALNPVHQVGRQIAEPLRRHRGLGRAEAERRAVDLLDRVGIADAARRAHSYPHQMSGGQRQRVLLAMALACQPDLLIADEPTTALDATVARQILALLDELVHEQRMGLLLISHDLDAVAGTVDRVAVMYGGMIVEQGPTDAVFGQRAHPYTRGLFAARPVLDDARINRRARPLLPTIPGQVPDLGGFGGGCPFIGRCALASDICAEMPPDVAVGPAHHAACVKVEPA